MKSFMVMHSTDKSHFEYKGGTGQNHASTLKTADLKEIRTFLLSVRHSCSSSPTKSALKVLTHTQMLAYIGLFLHVLLLVPMGSFLPLFFSSERERGKNSSSLFSFCTECHFIYYARVRDFVCQTV